MVGMQLAGEDTAWRDQERWLGVTLETIWLSHPVSTSPQEFQKSGVAQELKLLPNLGSYVPVIGVQPSDRVFVLVHVA